MKPARYDLDFFAGVDEAVRFEAVTIDGAPFAPGGATFTMRLLSRDDEVAVIDTVVTEEAGATVMSVVVPAATTASLGKQLRTSYRLDKVGGGVPRTYVHGALHMHSPADSIDRVRVRDGTVVDKPAVVRLSIETAEYVDG